jgi:hypothetical protein
MSDEIKDLAAALAKAQGQLQDAAKDATNPQFRSRYANLASVRDVLRKPLSDNGLSYVQLVRGGQGKVEVETMLMHASGQFIGECLVLPTTSNTAQATGSAITYARRYALMALVGAAAAEDDDDGEAASRRPPELLEGPPPPTNGRRDPEGAPSEDAVKMKRAVRGCRTLSELQAMTHSGAFKTAWATMTGVGRRYIILAVERRRAELQDGAAPAREPA